MNPAKTTSSLSYLVKILRNRFRRSLKDIERIVEKCLKKADSPFLKSLCRCSYLSL